jgi:hypothetical protein
VAPSQLAEQSGVGITRSGATGVFQTIALRPTLRKPRPGCPLKSLAEKAPYPFPQHTAAATSLPKILRIRIFPASNLLAATRPRLEPWHRAGPLERRGLPQLCRGRRRPCSTLESRAAASSSPSEMVGSRSNEWGTTHIWHGCAPRDTLPPMA